MKRVAYKRVGEPLQIESTDFRYQYQYADKILGEAVTKYNQRIDDNGFLLVVDDDGWAKNLTLNFYLPGKKNQVMPIKGDVAFIRVRKPDMFENIYDYDIIDLTETDIAFLQYLLSNETQEAITKAIESSRKEGE